MTHQYKVNDKKYQGKRLDIFLSENLVELSRSKIKYLIKNSKVLVNGEIEDPDYKISLNDKIKIDIEKSKESINEFIRNKGDTAYHPSCTCKMGNDESSVVNEELKVYGIDKLRVVDASIMPNIITGNLNAATVMIAEKASDLILNRSPLELEEHNFYRANYN